MSNLLGLEVEKASTGEYDEVDLGPDPEWVTRTKRGANWFYWISGLSAVNTLAYVGGANLQFLGGLGITQIANGLIEVLMQQGSPIALNAFVIAFDAVAIIGFALAGYYANKFIRTAFLIGIIVYSLDTLIVLVLGDYFMAAFHAFALYSLISGFIACRHIKAHLKSQNGLQQSSELPPPPPASLG